jgi:hypothetical protein
MLYLKIYVNSISGYTNYIGTCQNSRDENVVFLSGRKIEMVFYENFEMCGLFLYMYFM